MVDNIVVNIYSCSHCSFSTLRYDKLKEHLHKQHKVGSAPERRVRITDLVNLDTAKSLEGSVCQPVLLESMQQDAPDTGIIGETVSCVVDLNTASGESSCPETQQSIIVVEPVDFLLGSVHTIEINIPTPAYAETDVTSEDVSMSSVLMDADSLKRNTE